MLGGEGEMWGECALHFICLLLPVMSVCFGAVHGCLNRRAFSAFTDGLTAGETVDPSDIDATVWPRQAAVLERLWSYNVITNSSDPTVQPRLENFRCFLHRFGVGAAPVTNSQAREAPPGPGSCYAQ